MSAVMERIHEAMAEWRVAAIGSLRRPTKLYLPYRDAILYCFSHHKDSKRKAELITKGPEAIREIAGLEVVIANVPRIRVE